MPFTNKTYNYPCDSYSECHPYEEKLWPGVYFFQAWGAQGGGIASVNLMGGKGGYASGYLTLKKPTKVYIYVGHHGSSYSKEDPHKYAYNGVSEPGWSGGGGGATDFRLFGGEDLDSKSLSSRILVAGGGGGGEYYTSHIKGGVGGGIKGGDAETNGGKGGTQYAGGKAGTEYDSGKQGQNDDGHFGYGGKPVCDTASGGGGYYGGGSGSCVSTGTGAGGGSGYVSGHPDCPLHPSGIFFINPLLLDGSESFPSPTSINDVEIGHELNGVAKITYVGHVYANSCFHSFKLQFSNVLLIIFILS